MELHLLLLASVLLTFELDDADDAKYISNETIAQKLLFAQIHLLLLNQSKIFCSIIQGQHNKDYKCY